MNIELTIYGQVYMAFAVLIGVLCLPRRTIKSDSATSVGVIGFVLSIFQPFGLFYLLYLLDKVTAGKSENELTIDKVLLNNYKYFNNL